MSKIPIMVSRKPQVMFCFLFIKNFVVIARYVLTLSQTIRCLKKPEENTFSHVLGLYIMHNMIPKV